MGSNPFADGFDAPKGAHVKASEPQGPEAFAVPASEFTLVLERYHAHTLEQVVIPDGVTQILDGAFRGHDELVSVVLPDTLQSIGPRAFSGCSSLREIRIPEGVFEIGRSAFSGCKALVSASLPDGLLRVSESLFQGCTSLKEVRGGAEVDELAGNAFAACEQLEGLELLSHVRTIGSGALAGCALSRVELPLRMEGIAAEAFRSCRHLTYIKLPEEIGSLGNNIFLNCANLHDIGVSGALVSRFPGAFPRTFTDGKGLLRPQDERREAQKYVRLHKEQAAEVRNQLAVCRNAIRVLRNERDGLGVFERARKQELDDALDEQRALRAALKARLEALENPTHEQLVTQKQEQAAALPERQAAVHHDNISTI